MTTSRRDFLRTSTAATLGGLALSAFAGTQSAIAQVPNVPGFDDTKTDVDTSTTWQQKFDRKIKMGLVGFGYCQFGLAFSLQNHPNVELVAVSDIIPERCAAMAQAAKCAKTYPSLEEMVKDDSIEAIFVGTDAPSHGRHCLEVLKHGKHVATAIPAVVDNLEEADMLYEMVKKTGLNYMMFETSVFHDRLYAMRQIYNAGGFGKLVYSEGEYYSYTPTPVPAYKDWRTGFPPQFYPTHSNAYYTAVTGGSFTEVSCLGNLSIIPQFMPENNVYKNPFCSEVALFRTSEGGMSRMAVTWGTAGIGGETGRVSGQKGSFWGNSFQGLPESNELVKTLNLKKPPLPPSVDPGGHGGSHGYLGHEFVMSILEKRKPLVDIAWSLNMTVSGTIAHRSALKDGELMKIPQYTF